MRTAVVALVSYVIGCVVSAYYVVRARARGDIRAAGSGTAGARNVFRVHGRGAAAVTLLLDAAKGLAAVFLASRMHEASWATGLAFVFVVVGHIWPAQLGFHGGKGAAPSLGAMLGISPASVLIALAVIGVAWAGTRRVTRSGLLGIAAAPVAYATLGGPVLNVALVAVACAVVLLAHHPRMARAPHPGTGAGA